MATRGPKTIEPWEKWRAIAWVYEVLRQTQTKMETQLASDDPFRSIKKKIQNQWKAQQRHDVNRDVVHIYDLDKFLWGLESARTDFAKYARGENARLQKGTLEKIDKLLPGSKTFYEVGPNGVPLWAALRGQITSDDFWLPLVNSGQVDDVLELFLGGSDLRVQGIGKEVAPVLTQYAKDNEGNHIIFELSRPKSESTKVWKFKHMRPKEPEIRFEEIDPAATRTLFPLPTRTMQRLPLDELTLQRAINYEAHTRLHNLPWWDMVRSLKRHVVPFAMRQENHIPSKFMAQGDDAGIWFTMGEATLEIALAHMASKEKVAFKSERNDLHALLQGTLPVWKKWGEFYKLKNDFYNELVELNKDVATNFEALEA